MRYPWTFLSPDRESVAVWIPPGGVELTHDEESGLERLLLASTGRGTTDGILEIMAQFDEVRPREPHFYLGLDLDVQDCEASRTVVADVVLGRSIWRATVEDVKMPGVVAWQKSSAGGLGRGR
jgi:hypothetical protein